MVRSLGLVGLAVLGMIVFTLRDQPSHPPVTVDVASTVQAARSDAGFPVLAAPSLPGRWYANTARFVAVAQEPGKWEFHIGYSDGEGGYIGVDESSATDPSAILGGYTFVDPVAQRTIAGIAFDRYAQSENDVWMHRASSAEPYTIVIGTNSPDGVTIVRALRADGAFATAGPTAS